MGAVLAVIGIVLATTWLWGLDEMTHNYHSSWVSSTQWIIILVFWPFVIVNVAYFCALVWYIRKRIKLKKVAKTTSHGSVLPCRP